MKLTKKTKKKNTIQTAVEIEKETLLRYKAICIMKELTISGEIEKMMRAEVLKAQERKKPVALRRKA